VKLGHFAREFGNAIYLTTSSFGPSIRVREEQHVSNNPCYPPEILKVGGKNLL